MLSDSDNILPSVRGAIPVCAEAVNRYRQTAVRSALAAVAWMAVATPLGAQGEPLEELLVTGSYSPRAAVTSSVSVLEGPQIAALNKRTLADLLKTIPGVLVEEQGGAGGLSAVSIRGGEANFTLVLVDGVAVNDPTNTRGGGFDFANLNSTLVERIEVVRGAASAVYGSDALAGVINIITRRPRHGHTQALTLGAGGDGYGDYSATALGRADTLAYTLEIARRDDGNSVPGSERDSDSATIRLGWQPNTRHALDLRFRYLDGERSSYPEQSGGPRFALLDDLDHAAYQDKILAASWAVQLREGWRSRLVMTRFEHEEDYLSPGIPPFFEVPPNGAETDFRRDKLQWVNSLEVGPGVKLDIGGDYQDEHGESVGYVEYFGSRSATDFLLERSSVGVFAAILTQPVEGLLLDGGLRYDDAQGFSAEVSPKVGMSLEITPGTRFSANWAEAFKLPSFFALGHALVGNPELEPEQVQGWDVGLAWEGGAGQRLAATGFFNDFSDLVDFDDETFRNVNRQQVETRGVELEALWPVATDITIQANGTYTEIDVKGEDTVLTGRPEWSAGLLLGWQVAAQWHTTLDYRYTGRQWAISRHTGGEVAARLSAYHRVDWALQWQPTRRWQFKLAIDNLLGETYATAIGFPAPERTLRFGIHYLNEVQH